MNFNPAMAKAARITIAVVEEVVPLGTLKPDEIHLPGIYVHRLVQGSNYQKRIEKLTLSDDNGKLLTVNQTKKGKARAQDDEANARRERIVRRAAQEFKVRSSTFFINNRTACM